MPPVASNMLVNSSRSIRFVPYVNFRRISSQIHPDVRRQARDHAQLPTPAARSPWTGVAAQADSGHRKDPPRCAYRVIRRELTLIGRRRQNVEQTRASSFHITGWRGSRRMVQVMAWLLEREYQQHRNLDYYGLPETFAAWQELTSGLAGNLSRVTGRRVVKVVIHPGELEEWARRRGRAVDARVRSDFAGTHWRTQNAYVADPDLRMRTGAD